LVVLLAAGCSGILVPGGPIVEPGPAGELPPAVVQAARDWLAAQLNQGVERIEINEFEQVEWSDSCLGLGQSYESCLAVITPGWRIVFAVDGVDYEVRTNADGSVIRLNSPAVVQAAQAWLAAHLNLAVERIVVKEFEQVEWSDSCLGLGQLNESCLAAITPGWRVVFTVDGVEYEVRTDADAAVIRLNVPASLDGLAGTAWALESFGPVDNETPAIPNSGLTLNFGADGQASGNAGCNLYNGGYLAQAGQVTLGPLASTKRACADDAMTRQESDYLAALGSVSKYDIAGDRLVLTYAGGVLNFSAAPTEGAQLAGSQWTL
jgi:putative lipoprotein